MLGRMTRRGPRLSARPLMLLCFIIAATITFAPKAAAYTVAQNCGDVVGGCGPFGTCHMDETACGDDCKETCKCNDGYDGADCSLRVQNCPDEVAPNGAQTCFNGGMCTMQQDYNSKGVPSVSWSCDCRNAVGAAQTYAGLQCEFPSTESCEIGKDVSTYAFCTNGGTCRQKVNPGEPHPLCHCGLDYEGRHCQYKTGTAPQKEMILTASSSGRGPPGEEKLPGFIIFLLVLMSIGVVAGVIYVVFVLDVPTDSPCSTEKVPFDTPNDLHLEDVEHHHTDNNNNNGNYEDRKECNVEHLDEEDDDDYDEPTIT